MSPQTRARRLARIAAQVRVCMKCPLHESRTLAVPGQGKASALVMMIGEAPGGEEDKTGRPFVGASGRFLNQVLEGTGIAREDFFITNVVKCRPPRNRTPRKLETDTCTSHYLFEQIRLLDPRLIVLLGGVAAKTLLGARGVAEVRGRILERDGRKYFVTYHPAVRFHRDDLAGLVRTDFATLKGELTRLAHAADAVTA
jgi:DNA polymerase